LRRSALPIRCRRNNTKPHGTMIKDIPRLQQAASRTH
jgi:hypothetical protein